MLKKENRLNLKKNFKFVASGEKISSQLFNIFFRFGDSDQIKIGVATSKANFSKATERNKARRLIFSGFEPIYKSMPQKLNLIILPRQEILKLNSMQVTEHLKKVLEKRRIIS